VLWADAWRQVSATQFPADLSLAVLAAVVIGGIGSIAGAVAGGVVVYGLTFLVNPYVSNLFSSQAGSGVGFELLLGGLGLILALRKYPQGIAGAVQSWWQGRIDQLAAETEERATAAAEGPALRVEGVGLSFGAHTALDDVSIEVDEGEIVGLIGPNGAGKTTLLNVISGVLRADAGAVFVGGVEVSEFPPELRATFGLGRSFQQASLFPGLTVTETMQVAMSTQHRVGVLASATSAPWVRAGEVSSRQAALALLERFGLTQWADVLTDELSTGTRRISIEVDEVDFSYGRLQVLFGVSLHVEQGEALALLGTNGAGKSTLLRLVCGLERPSSGCITYEGRDITGLPAERLVGQGLALIVGGRAIFPDLTVRENLDIQAIPVHRQRATVRARMAEVLDTFPALKKSLRRHAGTMSGGEQQQLALAKALLLDPKVLCIDELSLGLAPVLVQELMAIVRSLTETGLTLVIVEQSLSVACQICERAVFMEKGEVRFEGRAADLLERDDIARAVFLGGK
jgi:ABC-type branched-subunit amino acid transport system ATPase component